MHGGGTAGPSLPHGFGGRRGGVVLQREVQQNVRPSLSVSNSHLNRYQRTRSSRSLSRSISMSGLTIRGVLYEAAAVGAFFTAAFAAGLVFFAAPFR